MLLPNLNSDNRIVVSGMRATGALHLGHYHGVLKNWIKLQHEYKCLFFVADWHALTTHYEDPANIEASTWEMIITWLSVGMNPGSCHLFIQSRVPEHAELHLLLSMITPLGWLERVPTYKDQQEKLNEKDLSTYGFLGYPLLQTADVLIYKAGHVPVGEDQVAHLELSREVARRFNHLYGREKDYEEKAALAIKNMGKKNAKLYEDSRKRYQETGDDSALALGRALVGDSASLSLGDKERLNGYLEGIGKIILPEPQALLTEVSKFPGLDGQKMSKSYGNTIGILEAPDVVEQKIKVMPTDPARVRRQDPGEPEKCPVWAFHKIYSNEGQKEWVQTGCRTAGIGCLDCKQVLSNGILQELAPIRAKADEYRANPGLVREIVREGVEVARDMARATLEEVREAMGLPQKDR
jgi:tryptophanyl-tRNA synthetase